MKKVISLLLLMFSVPLCGFSDSKPQSRLGKNPVSHIILSDGIQDWKFSCYRMIYLVVGSYSENTVYVSGLCLSLNEIVSMTVPPGKTAFQLFQAQTNYDPLRYHWDFRSMSCSNNGGDLVIALAREY